MTEDPIRVSVSWNTPLCAINRLLTFNNFRDLVDSSKDVPVHIVRVFPRDESGVPGYVVAVARAQTTGVVFRPGFLRKRACVTRSNRKLVRPLVRCSQDVLRVLARNV